MRDCITRIPSGADTPSYYGIVMPFGLVFSPTVSRSGRSLPL